VRVFWNQNQIICQVMLVVWICAADVLDATAQDSTSTPAQLVDRYGDPLPPGAKGRLGSVRLRHAGMVNGVAFSPDGKQLVSTGWDESIRFWDEETGKPIRQLTTDEHCMFAAAFSPDGTKLASVSERGNVCLWNLKTGKLHSKVLGHVDRTFGERVFGVAFSPDSVTVATAGADNPVRLWDAATGAALLTLESDEGGSDARPVAFSPDGSLLASGTQKGTIQIWNLATGDEPTILKNAHQEDVISLVFTSDGTHLISSGTRYQRIAKDSGRHVSEIHLWNSATGEKQTGFTTAEELLGDCNLALSHDGRTLASAHYEKIVLWDVELRTPKKIIHSNGNYFGGRTHGLAISPDNRLVAARSGNIDQHKVHLWNLQTGEEVLPQENEHTDAVLAVDASGDGLTIATGSADGTVRIWNAATGEHRHLLDKGSGWVRYVQYFPDGKLIALGRETHAPDKPKFEGELKICRVSDGKVVHHFPVPDRVMCGALSRDGKLLAAAVGLGDDSFGSEPGPYECKIFVWETSSGRQLAELTGHQKQILDIQFTNRGDQLWSTSEDQTLRKWSVNSAKEGESSVRQIEENRQEAGTGMFIPGSTLFVTQELKRLEGDVGQGKLTLREIVGNQTRWEKTFSDFLPRNCTASADGKLLAVFLVPIAGKNAKNRVAVFRADDGQEVISFDLNDNSVRSLAFSRDAKFLLAGMSKGDTLLWDISAAHGTIDKPRREPGASK
jgi:WD40 repeat protein